MTWANMALRGRSKYLIFWSPKERKTVREEEEEEEEEGAKIKQSQAPKRYGTTNLVYGSLVLCG